MSQFSIQNFVCDSLKSRGSREILVFALLAATSAASVTSRASAQNVDHAKIEALFQILQAPGAGVVGLSPPPLQAPAPFGAAPGPAPFTAPVSSSGQPAGLVPAPSTGKSNRVDIPSVPFSDVMPDGSNCPSDPKAFEAALNEMLRLVNSYETLMIELSKAYDGMDAENLSLVMSDAGSCPEEMREAYKGFLDDIELVRVADNILPAENLQLCAQAAATRLDGQIKAIGLDASREDQNRRMTLSRVMRSVASLDEMATDVVKRMVSLEQKRQRLVSGINQFELQCEAFENVSFSADYK